MTLERLAAGMAKILAAIAELDGQLGGVVGRLDRVAGRQDELTELVADLRAQLPEPERWCPRWIAPDFEESGVIYCEGGYKLMRGRASREGNKRAREWTHPLPADVTGYSWNEEMKKWVEARWHNVYESQALKAPPAEGERPWPRDGAEGPPAHDDDESQPF
jgi:hypothetical protein